MFKSVINKHSIYCTNTLFNKKWAANITWSHFPLIGIACGIQRSYVTFRRRTTLSLKFRNKKPRISVFVYKYSNDYQWNEFWWRSKFRIWREYDQMCTKKYHVRNNMMFNGNSIYFWVIRIKIYYVPFYVKMQLNINFLAIPAIYFSTSAATDICV